MVCQYSTRGFVSSGKPKTPSEAGAEARGGDTLGMAIAAEVPGGYGSLLVPPEVVSRAAKVAKTLKSRTPARSYICDAVLQALARASGEHHAGVHTQRPADVHARPS